MSAALRIDALKRVRRLTEVGMEQVAEGIVEGLAEADTSELATKSDLGSATAELKAELKADIAALRTDMLEIKAEMFRFMLLQAIGIVGLTVTLIKLLP
jgi:hypothetical protein